MQKGQSGNALPCKEIWTMKKVKIIIPIILLIIVTGMISAYSIYGSTLIDITSEKSINKHIAIEPEKPITILKTAKVGDYFGILYQDPSNEEYDYSFRYITKSPFYKNRYYNIGSCSNFTGSEILDFTPIKSSNEEKNKTDIFLHYFGKNRYTYDTCSIFTYNRTENVINYEEITKTEEITEKMNAMAASLKKIDEIELPNNNIFIITKTYDLDYPYEDMLIYDGSVTEEKAKQDMMAEADVIIKEYYDFYLKGKNNA